ncbi:MAG TPA: hypothetical protein VF834_18460 [Streptosporangiaceae bacterium]
MSGITVPLPSGPIGEAGHGVAVSRCRGGATKAALTERDCQQDAARDVDQAAA